MFSYYIDDNNMAITKHRYTMTKQNYMALMPKLNITLSCYTVVLLILEMTPKAATRKNSYWHVTAAGVQNEHQSFCCAWAGKSDCLG